VLSELLLEQPQQGRLPREAVSVLREQNGNPTARDEIPDAIKAGAVESCATVAGIFNLLQYLVSFTGRVLPQRRELLGDAVTVVLGLLLGGDAGVKYCGLAHEISSLSLA
jgi:hypothetical protein